MKLPVKKMPGFLSAAVVPSLFLPLAFADTIEEIRVTADFREISAAQYPASLTVVDSSAITARAAQHLDEILNLAPNVNFSAGASRGRYIQIRGIGERSQFVDPLNPSVGLTIDNINFSGVGNVSTLYDIDQVEILRGPQGTRFGANGLAGMVNIVSKAPVEEFEAQLSGGVSNYDSWQLGALVNGALSENVVARLAVQQYKSDGFIDNTFLNRDDTAQRDEFTVRGKIHWLVNDDFTVDTTLMYVDVDNGYDNFSLDNNRKTLSDEPGQDSQETLALGITGVWTGNDYFTVKTTVAFERTDVEYGYDEDWTNTQICDGLDCDSALWGFDWWYSSTDNYQRERESVQLDMRLVSAEKSKIFDRIDWVAGIYFYDRIDDLHREFFDWDLYQPGEFDSEYDSRNIAIYGELSTALTEQLTLTVGGRVEAFSADYSDSRQVAADPDESLWGGEISLEYQMDDNTLVYGLISHGFKAGGVNGEALGQAQKNNFDATVISFLNDRLEFETETANNFELGLKGHYLDDRWQLRMAAFYMERDDVQLKGWYNEGPLFVGYTDNGSTGKNLGIEIETVFQIAPQIEVFASAGYLDTEIKDFFVLGDNGLEDKSGREQAHAPNYQFNVGTHWNPISNLRVRLEVEGKDNFYYSDSHDQKSESYTLVHASVTYLLDNIEFKLWGRNLADKDYAVRGFYFANDPRVFYGDGQAYTQLGDPRTFGLTATYNF